MQRFDINGGLSTLCGNVAAEHACRPFQQLSAPRRDLVRVNVKLCAISASVFSPFTAASATFALNAGL